MVKSQRLAGYAGTDTPPVRDRGAVETVIRLVACGESKYADLFGVDVPSQPRRLDQQVIAGRGAADGVGRRHKHVRTRVRAGKQARLRQGNRF